MVWLGYNSRSVGGKVGAFYNSHTIRSAEPPRIWGGGDLYLLYLSLQYSFVCWYPDPYSISNF
jgi:hypothetical protein